MLSGHHTLVVMPTGAGKSLIYQLAALLLPGTTLVISPLIALMKDQVDSLVARGLAATDINSTIGPKEQRGRLQRLAEGGYKLAYVAPERLRSRAFRQALSRAQISLLAVDEAHCISQWGHDFRPDYLQIAPARETLGEPITLALTATATLQVQDDIVHLLNLPKAQRVVTGFNRPNLIFEVIYTPDTEAKLRALQNFLTEVEEAGIIYVGTRREAEEVAAFVQELGFEALYYHAGLDAETRTAVQESFMAGDTPIIVATNAFGMGVDRADLRFVLHYSLPGTVEAYYQEAGRAGRDGLSARCPLLYSPEDRALQEWFIENDAPGGDELKQLYAILKSEAQEDRLFVTLHDLERTTGQNEIKVRVGLSQLEMAGAVHHLGDEGPWMELEIGDLPPGALTATAEEVQARRAHKRRQLARMIAYAEGNTCRRRAILDHFGDKGLAEAPTCCDNCLAQTMPQKTERCAESQAEWAALVILSTVAELRWEVGRSLLAKILKGSKARQIKQFGYDRLRFYGRLAALRIKEIEDLINQLLELRHLKMIGGDRPVLRLTPQGRGALKAKAAIPLRLARPISKARSQQLQAQQVAGGTVAYTAQLWAEGLTPAQIAARRNLTESTIYGHLAKLIAAGEISVDDVVPADVQKQVRVVIKAVGDVSRLAPLKFRLPESISYGVVSCVVAAWEREHDLVPERTQLPSEGPVDEGLFQALRDWRLAEAQTRNQPAFCIFHDSVLQDIARHKPTTLEALKALKGIGPTKLTRHGEDVIQIVQDWAQKSPASPSPPPAEDIDPVSSFLSRSHPRPLSGPWAAGWALDFHSGFSGERWARTETGELTYRFKYEGQRRLAGELVNRLTACIAERPHLRQVDALLPVPSTTRRDYDPVSELAAALGQRLGLPVLKGALVKTRATQPQKDMHTLAQKQANVAGAFAAQEVVRGKKLLVLDDLYDSGATLAEVTRTLQGAGASKVVVLTLTKTIHTD